MALGTAGESTDHLARVQESHDPPVRLGVVGLLVQKFGGTSVADPDRIRAVAEHIVRTRRDGNDVVVVVSAMGKTTDDLERLAHDVAADPPEREMDMLLTAGERISAALLCMAIMDRGERAVSFTGSQAGIVTDTAHRKAKIVEIRADRIQETLDTATIAVVAGFQGVSTARDITTLGRGASDLTAVALAATLGADVCEIYTDVAGVYTADPRVVPEARKLARISYDEMLEMAATGGRVLAMRSVEFARNYQVPVHVRSSFTWEQGTWVTEEEPNMEQPIISGVTHDVSEAKVTIFHVPDRPGIAAALFRGARRRQRERRHDRTERLDRRLHRHLLHHSQGRAVAHDGCRRQGRGRDRGGRRQLRRRDRPSVPRGRGDAHEPGSRCADVRDPCRREREHRDDLHVDHPDLLRRARARRRSAVQALHRSFELETSV